MENEEGKLDDSGRSIDIGGSVGMEERSGAGC